MNWAIPAILYLCMVFLLLRRLHLMAIALVGVLFSTTWMLVSSAYIDSHPGVYAEELFRRIGGGWSALRLVSFYGLITLAFLMVFTRGRIAHLADALSHTAPREYTFNGVSIYALSNVAMMLFVAALYVQLLRGPIPLLTGMDRVTYKVRHGSLLLAGLYKYCSFISFFAGVLLLYQIRQGRRRGRNVTMVLYLFILTYFVLIGNKFSTPFFSLCMFLMPLGLMSLLPRRRLQDCASRRGRVVLTIMAMIVMVVLFGTGVYKYYTGFGGRLRAQERLVQRVGVKQAQLWWCTSSRVYGYGEWSYDRAMRGVFTAPAFGSKGNTALLHLICRNVGSRRALFLLRKGYLYTGAYPAILLELAGPVGAYAVMLVMALSLAGLLYLMYRAIAHYHYLTIFFLAFILQPFVFAHIGGNLYFMVKSTFAIKVCLALLSMAYDNRESLVSVLGVGRISPVSDGTTA